MTGCVERVTDYMDTVDCGEPVYRAGRCAAHFESLVLHLDKRIIEARAKLEALEDEARILEASTVVGDGRQTWHLEPCPSCKRPRRRKTVGNLPPRANAACCAGLDTEACQALTHALEEEIGPLRDAGLVDASGRITEKGRAALSAHG